ncbi:MAG: DegV family protein [Desulfocucumaceae bacterium]
MSIVSIVTDSTADLPLEIVNEYNITVVPLKVFFGQEEYLDGIDITPDQFFRRQVAGEISTTSQPSPAEFVDCYRPLIDAGKDIISIHISSLMSGTVQSANLARQMLNYPGLEVVDSEMVSIPVGCIVLLAARAAREGKSLSEIKALIGQWKQDIEVYFMVDSLEYLQRGGRIGKAQAFLGTLLNVKPILTIDEGLICPFEKVRGKSKALGRLISILRDKLGQGRRVQCWVTHGDFPEGMEEVKKGLLENFCCEEIFFSRLGPVVGTHVGPVMVGVVCIPVKE